MLREVISEERAALLRQYEEDKDTPEACFIEAAIQELTVRKEPVFGRGEISRF